MSEFLHMWLICCGIAGILIAVIESKREHPHTMAVATVAWVVILLGVVLNNQKIDSTHRDVIEVRGQLTAAAILVREARAALQARDLIEDEYRRGRVLRDDFVPLPRPLKDTEKVQE